MNISVNGEPHEVTALNVAEVLIELGYGEAHVATALNGDFIPSNQRAESTLTPDCKLEILAPMQGG